MCVRGRVVQRLLMLATSYFSLSNFIQNATPAINGRILKAKKPNNAPSLKTPMITHIDARKKL